MNKNFTFTTYLVRARDCNESRFSFLISVRFPNRHFLTATFGQPRCGNSAFAKACDETFNLTVIRVTQCCDILSRWTWTMDYIPWINWEHCGIELELEPKGPKLIVDEICKECGQKRLKKTITNWKVDLKALHKNVFTLDVGTYYDMLNKFQHEKGKDVVVEGHGRKDSSEMYNYATEDIGIENLVKKTV